MGEQKEFPLAIWQNTEEYKKEYEMADGKFRDIYKKLHGRGFTCTYLGDLRADSDGYLEVWLNPNMPWNAYKQIENPEDAIPFAMKHGGCGWWRLNDLEEFANGRGPILERAMWDLGYRQNKIDSTKWAKKMKGDMLQYNSQKKIDEITGEELERLNQLWAFKNENAGVDCTYNIQVGERGLIHVALNYNPFNGSTTETLWVLGAQARNRGHIAKQQNGFYIEAKKVLLDKQEGIHIKSIKPDKSYSECIWPIQTPTQKLYALADDLVSRVKCIPTQ